MQFGFDPRRALPNHPSFDVSGSGGSNAAASPPFSRSVNDNGNRQSNRNFTPLNDFMAIGDKFSGRCHYVKVDHFSKFI